MLDIVLPALPGGAATVLRWLAESGAALESGAPLLIVRTETVEAALPAPEAGTLGEILVGTGERAEPGAALARLTPPALADRRAPLRATPLARSIAAAHGIELSGLSGSGGDGRIVAADVLQESGVGGQESVATPAPSPQPLPSAPQPLPSAPQPLPSAPQAPVATAMIEFDASAAQGLCAARAAEFSRRGLRASLAACVAAAIAELLPRHRALNARWTADGLLLRRRVHLAIAAASGAALSWSLVRDAGDLTLRGVARAMAAPADPAELRAASFAMVSMAEGAAWHSAPPPPVGSVAALCLGAPCSRPVAHSATLRIRPIATLSLSYDARAIDHGQAMAFLHNLRARLESL